MWLMAEPATGNATTFVPIEQGTWALKYTAEWGPAGPILPPQPPGALPVPTPAILQGVPPNYFHVLTATHGMKSPFAAAVKLPELNQQWQT